MNCNLLDVRPPDAGRIISSREAHVHAPREEATVHLRVEINDGSIICRPVGTLDAYTAPRLREAMALMASAQNLVIDLSEVSFVDSAALAALINGIRRLREGGGQVAVSSPRPNVRRVLETIGFERVASMVETIDEARRILTTRATPVVTVA